MRKETAIEALREIHGVTERRRSVVLKLIRKERYFEWISDEMRQIILRIARKPDDLNWLSVGAPFELSDENRFGGRLVQF
jgi:hypothetical protein